jgi:hypothetical protein
MKHQTSRSLILTDQQTDQDQAQENHPPAIFRSFGEKRGAIKQQQRQQMLLHERRLEMVEEEEYLKTLDGILILEKSQQATRESHNQLSQDNLPHLDYALSNNPEA